MVDEDSQREHPPKLLGSFSLKVRLAFVSIVVLVAGALLAPRAAPTAVPASQERPTPLLEQEVQRREPLRLFRPVQEIARQIVVHNVTIPPPLQAYPRSMTDIADVSAMHLSPAGFGVFVDEAGTVLSHAAALRGQSSLRLLTSDGASVQAQLLAHEASTGLVLLRTTGASAIVPAPLDTLRAEPGSLAATAARFLERTIVAPVFVTSAGGDSYAIDAHGAALAGMPLYNLDGQAFAIAAGSARGTAYPAREALDRLTARAASEKPIDAALGITFQALTPTLVPAFHASGALVTSVVPGGPAAAAGILHGDVITAIGDTKVESPESAQNAIAAFSPGTTTTLEFVRRTRTSTVDVTAGSAFALSGPVSSSHDVAAAAPVLARDVLSSQQIEAIMISPDAAVLEINGRSVRSRDEALAEWQRGRSPRTLYLEQTGVRFFAVLADAR
jgi:S1-C subfamily serine protease